MSGSLVAMITLMSVYASASALAGMEIPEVPSGHPRVYVRPLDLPLIRQKIEDPEFSKAWRLVKESDYMLCKAFVYMVTGDAEAGRHALLVGWMFSLRTARISTKPGGLFSPFFTLALLFLQSAMIFFPGHA